MKRFAILFALLVFTGGQLLYAQGTRITGTVTSSEDGLPVPGASVVVKGTTFGTITDFEGEYSLTVPEGTQVLVFSFVGMKTQEISIDGRNVIDVVMEPDVFGLDEVVVSGVASGTPRKKLSVTVATVSEESLKEVPATSAASALQGKIAGVRVVQTTGNPGEAAAIRLRGATVLYGSQSPLIILDGVQMEGTLADINIDDIESMEVVKGAAASALYGSRAGNGVIVITTKRGRGLAAGETEVTIRNEYGVQELANKMPVATHHFYKLKDDWESENRYTKYAGTTMYGDLTSHTNPDSIGILLSGARIEDGDHYMDNPFGVVHDHLDEYYSPGDFYTNYISIANNGEKTNFMASFENAKQQGIIVGVGGYSRQNFRFNIDHRIGDKFTFSTSNLIIKSKDDNGVLSFFELLQLQPDYDLHRVNPNGDPYFFKVDQFGTTYNPIYQAVNIDDVSERRRILSSFKLNYQPFHWLILDAQYSFEQQMNDRQYYRRYGTYTLSSWPYESKGYMEKWFDKEMAQTLQFTINLQETFGDFTAKGKLSYLLEDDKWEGFNSYGNDFSVRGVPDMSVLDQEKVFANSNTGQIVAENIFAILDVDYKAKYIASFLYRYDGASQFGADVRWNPYFRVSGAYRISEDVTIPGIQELKIRAAYGTSGNRPPWNAQYETWNIVGGAPVKNQLGNSELKPSTITETEVALNMEFLRKFDLEVAYSLTDAEDQFYPVPLPASAGYTTQWQNMGTLSSKSLEATLGVRWVENQNFLWTSHINFDRIRTKITELNVPPFTMGGRGNAGDPGVLYIQEGTYFGELWGQMFIRDMDLMAEMIEYLSDPGEMYADMTIDDFTINSDGYVIKAGTEGTVYEKPILYRGEDGSPKVVSIGDANPDFNMGISNTFSFKGFTLYTLFDWKQGGDVYSQTIQWMMRDNRAAEMDQYGKPEYAKKAYDYYIALYNVNAQNNHFVQDATYVKLREVSLYYNLPKSLTSNFLGGFFKSLRVGVVGRNLITWTNYTGFDPEVSTSEGNVDPTVQGWDDFSYPNYRTLTGTLEFKF